MKVNLPILTTLGLGLFACYKVFENKQPLGPEPAYIADVPTALQLSQAMKKPLVLIFSASWCPPCQTMKKRVYPSPEVAPYHNSVLWCYADVDKPEVREWAMKYDVSGIPHVVFINSDGTEKGEVVGGVAADEFASNLAALIKP
jgi:thiol:disulfide interchange protein